MDNVLSLRHRHDLDMIERMTRGTYAALVSNPSRHTERIQSALTRVDSEDDSAVHLEFCFTGYGPYKKNFTCAIWPRYPEKVTFHFVNRLDWEFLQNRQ